MGTAYNPRLATSGLVLYLDAGNPASYPGSGNSWSDLSGNGGNLTLTGSPGYSTAGLGSITFNGTSQHASAAGGLSGTNLSVSCWMYPSTAGSFRTAITNQVFDSVSTGYTIQQRNDGTFYAGLGTWGVSGDVVSSIPYTTNMWINITITYNGSTVRAYRNGSLFGSVASTRTVSAGTVMVGKGPAGASEFFSGNISNVMVHNKALSDAEIFQNFSALRGRYGI